MDIFGVLSLIGGLALFLYGMHVMGAGLEKMSGGRLERILENLTSNPLKAVLLGAGVTAVIQSSSATTVMVVGFVNSGIMKLSQAFILYDETGDPPVVLLDDVLSELDLSRQHFVLNEISEMQVFVTCCDPTAVLKHKMGTVFLMQEGKITHEI